MARQFFNLAEVMGQVDLSRARQQQMRENDMQMQRQERQDADLEAQNGALRDSFETVDGKTSFNNEKAIQLLAQKSPEMAYKLQQQMQDNKSSDLKYQMDLSQYAGNSMASATPQTWGIIKQDLISKGVKAAEGMPDTFDPDFQGKFLMDAKSFLKQSGGGDEDNLLFPTEQGMMYFNKKNKNDFGYLEKDGKRFTRSQDDAGLQGTVQSAKSRATAGYNVNTDVDGVVTTDQQLAEQLNPNLVMPPKGSQFGAPSMRVPPNLQQQRDATRLQVLLAEQQAEGGAGKNVELDQEIARFSKQPNVAGIRVPTKADQAASAQTAKDQAEFNSPENTKKRTQALEFKKTTGANMVNVLNDVTNRVDKFTAGIGGSMLKKLPSTAAYDLNADIETLKSNFGFDRLQIMRDMSPTGGALGSVAVQELTALQASVANLDINQSPTQLKKNLGKAKSHYENWIKTLDAGQKQNNEKNPAPPKKGDLIDGYLFLGGNPADQKNYKKAK